MQNRIVIFDLDGTIYQNSVFHRGYLRTLVAGTWAEPLEADLVRLAEAIFAGRELDMNRFYRRGRAEAATVPELVQALRKRVLPGMTYAEALKADDVVYLGDAWAVLAYLGDALGCLDGDRANEVYRLTRLQMEQAGMHGDRGLYEAIMRLEQRCRVVLLSNSYEETVREFLRQLGFAGAFREICSSANKPYGMIASLQALDPALLARPEAAAIGNPLGDLDYSLNVGYISAKARDVDLDGPSIRMMQLDAAINPGNSGGPLFDLRGNVVGVTTAKYSGETVTGATIEGIGFAIPINDVREILSELREYGRVPNRAQLGVMVGTVYSTNTARNGRVQVRDVTEDSAGAHAGLRDGDFILALDDYTVRTLSDLSAALRHYRGGQHATLTIERYGKTFRLPIVFDSKDDAVQNEEPTTSTNALEPSEQDSPRP